MYANAREVEKDYGDNVTLAVKAVVRDAEQELDAAECELAAAISEYMQEFHVKERHEEANDDLERRRIRSAA